MNISVRIEICDEKMGWVFELLLKKRAPYKNMRLKNYSFFECYPVLLFSEETEEI